MWRSVGVSNDDIDLDTVENRYCLLQFCLKLSLHNHNGQGSCKILSTKRLLTFTECHVCYHCLPVPSHGNYAGGFFLLKKTWSFFLYQYMNYSKTSICRFQIYCFPIPTIQLLWSLNNATQYIDHLHQMFPSFSCRLPEKKMMSGGFTVPSSIGYFICCEFSKCFTNL